MFVVMYNVIKDALSGFGEIVVRSLLPVSRIMEMVLPYIMLFIGYDLYESRGGIYIGGEFAVPFLVWVIIYFMRGLARYCGIKRSTLPVPRKRFTEVSEDGEVTAEKARLQEMLLYMADLEDWMQKRGYFIVNK